VESEKEAEEDAQGKRAGEENKGRGNRAEIGDVDGGDGELIRTAVADPDELLKIASQVVSRFTDPLNSTQAMVKAVVTIYSATVCVAQKVSPTRALLRHRLPFAVIASHGVRGRPSSRR
jgi:hypothetical protein